MQTFVTYDPAIFETLTFVTVETIQEKFPYRLTISYPDTVTNRELVAAAYTAYQIQDYRMIDWL